MNKLNPKPGEARTDYILKAAQSAGKLTVSLCMLLLSRKERTHYETNRNVSNDPGRRPGKSSA